MHESFSETTEQITHDSGVTLLEFQQMSQNPSDLVQTGEGVLSEPIGTEVDLANAAIVGAPGIPTVSPVVGDLTGGTYSDTPRLGFLTDPVLDGTIEITVTATDSFQQIYTVNAQQIATLAREQGLAESSFAMLALEQLADISVFGDPLDIKMIDTIRMRIISPFGPPGLDKAASNVSVFRIGTNELQIGLITLEDTSDITFAVGELGHRFDSLTLFFDLHGTVARRNQAIVKLKHNAPTGDQLTAADLNITFHDDVGGSFGGDLPAGKIQTDGTGVTTWTAGLGAVYTVPLGRTITLLEVNNGKWAASGISLPNGTTRPILQIGYPGNPSYYGSYDLSVGPRNQQIVLSLQPEDISEIQYTLTLNDDMVDVGIDIDAATMLAAVAPGDLTLHNATIIVAADLLAPYVGWTIQPSNFAGTGQYATTGFIHGPDSSNFVFLLQNPFPNFMGVCSRPGIPQFDYFGSGFSGLLVEGASMRIDLSVHDGPDFTYPPLLWTVPYETRNRNRPAFKIYFDPTTIPGDFTGQIDVTLFVSQGKILEPNEVRQWTICPVSVLPTVATPAPTAVIDVPNFLTNMPDAYSNGLIIIAADYIGPYDYVKLLITPHGENPPDFSGILMKIAANAREL